MQSGALINQIRWTFQMMFVMSGYVQGSYKSDTVYFAADVVMSGAGINQIRWTLQVMIVMSRYTLQVMIVMSRYTLQVMIVMSGVQYVPAAYGTYQFESWVQATGFGIAALPIACILVGFVVQPIRYRVGIHVFFLPVRQSSPHPPPHPRFVVQPIRYG